MKKLHTFKKRGFTLIELLVVIAIIGILASIVIVNVNSARQKAKKVAMNQSFNQIAKAMNIYYGGNWRQGSWYDGSPDGSTPPFVPEFYPSWNAHYYCADCKYALDAYDFGGGAGCAFITLYNTNFSVYIFRNIICDDCLLYCGFSN